MQTKVHTVHAVQVQVMHEIINRVVGFIFASCKLSYLNVFSWLLHAILLSSDWSAEGMLASDWLRGRGMGHMWSECLDNGAILRFISRLGGKQCVSYFLVKLEPSCELK